MGKEEEGVQGGWKKERGNKYGKGKKEMDNEREGERGSR